MRADLCALHIRGEMSEIAGNPFTLGPQGEWGACLFAEIWTRALERIALGQVGELGLENNCSPRPSVAKITP